MTVKMKDVEADVAERLYRQNLLADDAAREYRKCEIVHDVYGSVKPD